jgi:Carboxypeptidase regulatory-like domain
MNIPLRSRKCAAYCSIVFLFYICIPQRAAAQVSGATLSGTVTDSSGASIPNAQVAIQDLATGITRTVTTDSDGFYTAPNLLPDAYRVSVTANGFSTLEQSGITLTVGSQQVLNIKMVVGQVSQKVEVTSETPSVELATSSVGSDVDSTSVRELPLNGRDWTQLALLQPGVTSVGSLQLTTNGFQRGNRGFGTQMAISGSRPQQNNFRLDGISVNDYVNSGPGSVLGVALGVDAIAEFSVLSSNYSAEYGRTSGGVVNAISRSGSNQFHGSAYFFLRDEDFDARNYFDRPNSIPPFHRDQYGGSVGGPIKKDRTFFFVDYEGLGQDLGLTTPLVVPSAQARLGNLHDSSGAPITVTVSPLVQPYLAFWPLPTAPLGNGDTGTVSVVTQRQNSENFVASRIDHKFSASDSIFGTWQYDRGLVTQPDNLDSVLLGSKTTRQYFIIEETHTFSPQLLNSARFGFNRSTALNDYGVSAINPVAANSALGPDGNSAAPSIVVGGIASVTSGLITQPSTTYHFNDFQFYDDAFFVKGVHSLKFGFVAERMQDNLGQNVGLIAGQYKFGSLSNFLQDLPTSFRGNTTQGRLEYLRQDLFGGYLQDDVRWKPNVTVNLGLRYEMSTVPTEINNALANIGTLTASTIHLGNPYFSNPTLRNFEPRVGFAWDPFRDGKTSVRAGFGQFDVLPLTYEYAILVAGTAPFVITGNESGLAQDDFPFNAYTKLLSLPHAARVSYVQNDPKRNYVLQWNLNVQRQLSPSLAMTVSYVGNRGVHQPFRADDGDIVQPQLTSAGYLFPNPVGSGTKVNPAFGRADVLSWTNNTFFDALEVQAVKRMSHGFQIQGSYTWGKSIDLGSGSTHGDPFENSISSDWFFPGYQRLNRGLSDFNVAQHLVISYVWTLPGPKSNSAIASAALGGWEVGGIFTANTGLPFTPQMSPDPYGTGSTLSYAFPDRVSGPGCQSGVNPGNPKQYIKISCFALPTAPASFASQCATFKSATAPPPGGQVYCANLLGNAGRNSLIGPGLINYDFSLFKNFPIRRISETFNAQFRAEFFNIFNHPNFNSPTDNVQIFNASGAPLPSAGLIDATSTSSRQVQFALKLTW